MRFLLFTPIIDWNTPIIENALLKKYLKVERSPLHFMNLNLSLTKNWTKRKLSELSEPLSVQSLLSSGGRTKDL